MSCHSEVSSLPHNEQSAVPLTKSRFLTPVHTAAGFGVGMTCIIGAGELSGRIESGGSVQAAPFANFAFNRAGVWRVRRRRGDSGMEITVGAPGLAEGHLNVNPEGLFRRKNRREDHALSPLDDLYHGLLDLPTIRRDCLPPSCFSVSVHSTAVRSRISCRKSTLLDRLFRFGFARASSTGERVANRASARRPCFRTISNHFEQKPEAVDSRHGPPESISGETCATRGNRPCTGVFLYFTSRVNSTR